MINYYENFKFCPQCGKTYQPNDLVLKPSVLFTCSQCNLKFFQNSKPTTSAMIPNRNNPKQLLFTKRAIEPSIGLLDFPGGFIEYHEDPEHGIMREIQEELNIEKYKLRKLFYAAHGNYIYQNVYHSIISLYYLFEPTDFEPGKVKDKENESCLFYDVDDILKNTDRMAFSPDILAVEKYMKEYC